MKKKLISLFICIIFILQICVTPVFAVAKVYRKSIGSTKKVALTFDDGPHPRLTSQILEILDEYKIKATFFVIGQNVDYYPAAMELLAKSGCEIGNHTYSHRSIRTMSDEQIQNEIIRCNSVLTDKFGITPVIMRPPQGAYNSTLQRVSNDANCDIILWSIDTRDWAHTPYNKIAQNVLGNVEGGDIILMHDYISGYSPTCEALRLIIPEMLERGYEFVTVSELIRDEI